MTASVDEGALEVAVREAKDTVGHQLQTWRVQFERADALVRLALAEAGALGALLGFLLTQRILADGLAVLLLALALLSNFAALLVLSRLSVARRRDTTVLGGPDLEDLGDTVLVRGASRVETWSSMLRTFGSLSRSNAAQIDRRNLILTWGLATLVVAGVLLLAAIAYIAGRNILA